ncbi:MAG TPA: hypothetical protein VNN79_05215 [Actinomycetota bacterium]|nr:hypothetical protein [Actinomycetota bacterium]
MLFGQFQIPVNMGGDLQISTMYLVARNTYTCTSPIGTPCDGGPYDPRSNQPHLEPVCDITGVAGLPGDPVGDCLIASAIKRLDALSGRYRHYSQELADGVYVEQLPWIETTMTALPVVDRFVRTGA